MIETQNQDIKAALLDSNCMTPLIFLLTSGADPMQQFLDVSKSCQNQI